MDYSQPQFLERNIKVIGISADALQEHYDWIDDIIEIGNKTAPTCVEYPIVRPFIFFLEPYQLGLRHHRLQIPKEKSQNYMRCWMKETCRTLVLTAKCASYVQTIDHCFDPILFTLL